MENIYIIENVEHNNSGMYICEASNTIDAINYKTTYSVEIDIGNIHSEVSDDQEDISEDNEYEEIESISCQDVNMINERIETSNQPIIEGEIVLENIHISTSSTISGSDITMIHSYVNTNIFNTNEHLNMSVNTETVSNHPNELENSNMGIGDTFVDNN
ncbi:unnamed protein product [Mytilus edulis]|uniref:Uncharacterized protein n=1 Tax=Mytilus edulis TaxID=6550 RepID=A0A8S3V9P2_MYTED|nr:unnamed protein product [Mytilus edulis]